jgi:hypothetical protein
MSFDNHWISLLSEFDLPCTEEAPTCLETCSKLLECQRHYCTERCHTGPCGTVSSNILLKEIMSCFGGCFIRQPLIFR